jgi:S-formylglutathione hydrolase FrmB
MYRMNAVLLMMWFWISVVAADTAPAISAAQRDADGFLSHTISSSYQPGATRMRVLLPDALKNGDQDSPRLPVVYMLPVEARDERRYGDGLLEVRRHDLHNKHEVIFVAPSFAQLPWYADHLHDPNVRQEAHLVQAVVPLIEKTYPAIAEPRGRLLVGFSKSGWGAWTLLIRHPEVFGRAAAWDAPLVTMQFGKFQSGPIFGSEANYAEYDLRGLLREQVGALGKEPRLILLGKGPFAEDTAATHLLLTSLSIPHAYLDGPVRKHDWHSGWVSEAVELLLASPLRPAADP